MQIILRRIELEKKEKRGRGGKKGGKKSRELFISCSPSHTHSLEIKINTKPAVISGEAGEEETHSNPKPNVPADRIIDIDEHHAHVRSAFFPQDPKPILYSWSLVAVPRRNRKK